MLENILFSYKVGYRYGNTMDFISHYTYVCTFFEFPERRHILLVRTSRTRAVRHSSDISTPTSSQQETSF